MTFAMVLTNVALFISSFVMVQAMVMAMVTGQLLFWVVMAVLVCVQGGVVVYRFVTTKTWAVEVWWLGATMLVVLMAWIVWGGPYVRGLVAERLYTQGVATPAVVLMVEETGKYYSAVPEVRTHLEIRPAEGASYRTTYRHIGYPLPVGTQITVYVDPKDAANVAIR